MPDTSTTASILSKEFKTSSFRLQDSLFIYVSGYRNILHSQTHTLEYCYFFIVAPSFLLAIYDFTQARLNVLFTEISLCDWYDDVAGFFQAGFNRITNDSGTIHCFCIKLAGARAMAADGVDVCTGREPITINNR